MDCKVGDKTVPRGTIFCPRRQHCATRRRIPGAPEPRTRYRRVMPVTETAARSEPLGRIPIRALSPQQPENHWPATGYVGEVVPFEATVFREGHGLLRAEVVITYPDDGVTVHPMELIAPGTDRWRAEAQLTEPGALRWCVRAASDDWASWLHDADIKIPARQDVELVFATAAELLADSPGRVFDEARAALVDSRLTPDARLRVAHDPRLTAAIAAHPVQSLLTESPTLTLRVERRRAAVGSWYEFFPRSEGAKQADGTWKSGTFRTAARRLPARRGDGLRRALPAADPPDRRDVPQGPEQHADAGPDDPGSPVGHRLAPTGGHDAIHPDLGTVADFTFFLGQAAKNGPRGRARPRAAVLARPPVGDRAPRVVHHAARRHRSPTPRTRRRSTRTSTRSTSTTTPRASAPRCCASCEYWIAARRHDLPRRQPAHEAARLLGVAARTRCNAEHPEVVFLAEAFTRPAMMQALAEVGFQQSYTYFTWRNTKEELEEFLAEISRRDGRLPAAEPVREHARHPHRVPAVRRAARVQDPRGDRRDRRRRPGASTRATSCSRTSPARAPKRTSTTRSTSTSRATARPAEAGAAQLARART